MDSILTSVKKMLGITEDYEHFDPDIIMHINSTFMILQQLGVGPAAGYLIQDKSNVWSEFLPAGKQLELVKSYMFMKVKLMFDISTMTSPLIEAYNKQIAEFEWRLNVQVDPGDDISDYEDIDILDVLYKNAVKNGYTGTKEEWVEKFNGNGGSGGGDASLKDDLIASIAAGGIKIGDRFVQGEELEALWRALLDPVKNPTLTPPSASITASGGTLMERGDSKTVTLLVKFDRGKIDPAGDTSGYRSGDAIFYNLNGVSQTNNTFRVDVNESNSVFTASVEHGPGEQPKNSKGEDYDAPLPAGTASSPVLRFEFVDALWSNAKDIMRIEKEPLVSKSAKTKVFEFAPQTKENPEIFDVPASWNVTGIEVLNEITQRYEDDASEFDISTVTHLDAAGNEVEYKRYTDNRGYAAGTRSIKITWS